MIAGSFVHRKGLPGHNSLIDRSLSGKNYAVNRNGFPGKYPERIPDFYIFCRNDPLRIFFNSPGSAGSKMNQFFNPRPGSGYGQIFQKRTQLHNKCDFTGSKVFADNDRSD